MNGLRPCPNRVAPPLLGFLGREKRGRLILRFRGISLPCAPGSAFPISGPLCLPPAFLQSPFCFAGNSPEGTASSQMVPSASFPPRVEGKNYHPRPGGGEVVLSGGDEGPWGVLSPLETFFSVTFGLEARGLSPTPLASGTGGE